MQAAQLPPVMPSSPTANTNTTRTTIGDGGEGHIERDQKSGCGDEEWTGDLHILANTVLETQRALAPPAMPRIDRHSFKRRSMDALQSLQLEVETDAIEETKAVTKQKAACSDLSLRISRTLVLGFQCMAEQVSHHLVTTETRSALSLVLSRDSTAPLYAENSRRNPTYSSVLVDMIAILKSPTTDDNTLFEVLGLMRGSIYLNDPYKPFRSPDTYSANWRAYLELSAVPYTSSTAGARLLSWIQSKYNTIGCAVAAMRLVGHRSNLVQVQAICLLLALLQDGNRNVQETMAMALKSPKNASFFVSISEVVQSTIKSLKDHKRKVRPKKASASLARAASAMVGWTEEDVEGIGRRSHVMLTLRLVQVMCAKQFQPLQDLMLKQTGASSVNMLRQMLDLFSSTQALINDLPPDKDPSSLMMLSVQVLETLSECLMGPNVRQHKEVLNSYFFFDVNRIFSSCYYVGVAPGRLWTSGYSHAEEGHAQNSTRGSASLGDLSWNSVHGNMCVNRLRSALKLSALKCCLSMFDTVTDAEMPQEMLGFFEVRNMLSQTHATSLLLGFEESRHSLSRLATMQEIRRGTIGNGLSAGFRVAGEWRPRAFGGAKNLASHPDNAAATGEGVGSDAGALVMVQQHSARFQGTFGALRLEIMRLHILVQYLAHYDQTGRVVSLLSQFSSEHPSIADYLHKHTPAVDISRTLRLTNTEDKRAMLAAAEEEPSEVVVQKVFFGVSEHMTKLIESKHFEQAWQDLIFSLPLDNPEDKFAMLMDKIQDVTVQSTWTQYLIDSGGLMRQLIKRRNILRFIPLYLSLAITLLLIVFYGIPLDPHTHYIVGDGRFHPAPWMSHPPAGYVHEVSVWVWVWVWVRVCAVRGCNVWQRRRCGMAVAGLESYICMRVYICIYSHMYIHIHGYVNTYLHQCSLQYNSGILFFPTHTCTDAHTKTHTITHTHTTHI